jgi:hypothetical protein
VYPVPVARVNSMPMNRTPEVAAVNTKAELVFGVMICAV